MHENVASCWEKKNTTKGHRRLVSFSVLINVFFRSVCPHLLNDTSTADFKVREKKCDIPEDMNMGGMNRFCWYTAHIVRLWCWERKHQRLTSIWQEAMCMINSMT